MRGWRLPTVTLLALAAVAGCIGIGDEDAIESQSVQSLDPSAIDAPEQAQVEAIENGVRLVFEDVELPLEQELAIPEGTELVRAEVQAGSDTAVVPVLWETDSEAYRCLPAISTAWNVGLDDRTRCSGLTAVDPKPANWTLGVYGGSFDFLIEAAGIGLVGTYESATAELVQVDMVAEASGGPIDDVDLDALSQPHHGIGETTHHEVESHDGAELFVDVTTPADGEHESYPTILVSSPYTTGDRQAGERPYDSLIQDYVPRGYAVVVADVRGFGRSDGCLEVWGPNEQADQAALVEWITDQNFSDGHVGMYGVSYVGTTPVEAAVQNPEGLDAVISTAGVINAYRDWHFGGVPNGESIGSPVFYQALGLQTSSPEPVERAMDTANGVCDPTLVQRANDPRAVYTDYFQARNFTERTDEVEAAVMVEHGYSDPNVKSSMQVDWFNDLDVPKLGLFGHWNHQPGARADEVTLRLAWMDQFVKGEDVGLGNVSEASISANGDRYREAEAWPDPTSDHRLMFPDLAEGTLGEEPSDGRAEILLDGTGILRHPVEQTPADAVIELTRDLDEALSLAGQARVHLSASLEGAENAYVAAQLYHERDDAVDKLVTFGWVNLAHRDDHASYDPLTPGERVDVDLPLIPAEYTFPEGDGLRLELRGVSQTDWGKYRPGSQGQLVVHGGADGTALGLDTVPEDAWAPTPSAVDSVPAE